MKVISYTSRFSNPQVLKLSTREGELLGFVHIPKYTNEFPIIGSPLPFHVFTDQSPLIHCLAKKVIIIPRSYPAQRHLTQFSIFNINITPDKYTPVADMLSRSFTKPKLQINYQNQKQLPPQIDFAIPQNKTPITYTT